MMTHLRPQWSSAEAAAPASTISVVDNRTLSIFVTVGVFAALWAILAKRGKKVAISACCFVASLVTTQLLMKKLSSPPYSFRFPGLVTALHFTLVWLACLVYWRAMGEPGKNWPGSMASLRRYCVMVIPIALCNPLTVVFNNKALVYVGAGLCAVIGTLSPVAVALLARVFGRVMSRLSWLGVLVAFSGGALITKTEIHDLDMGDASAAAAIAGIGFALASVGLRAFKIVLMDQLLAPAAYQGGSKGATKAEETLSPMHVYALQAGPAALVSVMFALSTESVGRAMDQLTPPVVRMISLTSVSAISLNFLGIFSLRDLGASMQQIIGKLNTICTMALSVGLLGETLPAIVLAGSGIVLAGVAIFEHGKRSSPESPTPSLAPPEDKQGNQSDEESHVHGTCGDSEETSRLVLRSAETSKEAERRRAV